MTEKTFKVVVDLANVSTIGDAMMVFLVALHESWANIHPGSDITNHFQLGKRIYNAQLHTAMAMYGNPLNRASGVDVATNAREAIACAQARLHIRRDMVRLLEDLRKFASPDAPEIEIKIIGCDTPSIVSKMERRFREWILTKESEDIEWVE